MIFDISSPNDLRVQLTKPSMTTDEIDTLLEDPAVDGVLKEALLADVVPQGYRRSTT